MDMKEYNSAAGEFQKVASASGSGKESYAMVGQANINYECST